MIVNTDNTTKFRGWCFTINNFSEDEKNQVIRAINNAKYGIAETEHEDNGTPHIQGYIYYENRVRFQTVKNDVSIRAHIEPAKGNPKQNYDYCSKEGNVFVKKVLPKLQEKPKFLEMFNDMKQMAPEEFQDKYPKEWYINREKVLAIMTDSAMLNVTVYNGPLEEKNIWLFGKPGVGKSKWATSQGEPKETFKKNFNKWWDGYSLISTHIVIIEDFPSLPQGNALVQHLKIWSDRYPFIGECKGSHLTVEPRRFFLIITSNYPIDACFENEEDKLAIHRRFKEFEVLEGDLISTGALSLDRKWIS